MFYEYCIYNNKKVDFEKKYKEMGSMIDEGLNGIAVPLAFFNTYKDMLPQSLNIAVPISYPMGIQDRRIKIHEIISAARCGVNSVDIVYNQQYLDNKKYKDFRYELDTVVKVCKDYGVTPRYMIDHRSQDLEKTIVISKILYQGGIEHMFPSANYHNDDWTDNLIATICIMDAVDINVIFNGYVWTEEQVKKIKFPLDGGARFFNKSVYSWCINS